MLSNGGERGEHYKKLPIPFSMLVQRDQERLIKNARKQGLLTENDNGKWYKYMSITTKKPNIKSNSNPTTKQHALVSIPVHIVTCPTCPEKFVWDNVIAPFYFPLPLHSALKQLQSLNNANWLGFNFTFSTVSLYCAFKIYSLVKRLISVR